MNTGNDSLTIPEFPKKCITRLSNLEIAETRPGPLIGSVASLLAYLEKNQVPAAGKHGHFPGKQLADMNACLPEPLPVSLKRPRMRSYPNLEALWLLLRITGLMHISGTKKPVLQVNATKAEAWRTMSDENRYAVLLEAWIIRGFPTLVEGRNPSFREDPLELWIRAYRQINWRGRQGAAAQEIASEVSRYLGPSILGCLYLFGFISISFTEPDPKGSWFVDKIKPSPIGEAFLKVFDQVFEENEGLLAATIFEELPLGILRSTLEPVFPNWPLLLPEDEATFQTGTMILKVSLGRARRCLAVPTTMTFEDLASGILRSVDFDADHLYQFEIGLPTGRMLHINHSYMEDPPWAGEVQLGETALQPGDRFRFEYDFGDQWLFEILVEAIEDRTTTAIEFLQARGAAPRQYAYPDDEYD